jgi:hypothetical protein
MAKNRDVFAKAFKSQPDALSELLTAPADVAQPMAAAAPVEAPVAVEETSVAAPVAPAKPAKAAKTAK